MKFSKLETWLGNRFWILAGRAVVVAITKGKLELGLWEQNFYGEFDGRCRKRVLVKFIGE